MYLEPTQLRYIVFKKLTNIFLVVTLVMSGLSFFGTPAIADSQATVATTTNRQKMAATQNRAGDFAKSKRELDQEFGSVVSDVEKDLEKAASKTIDTATEIVKDMADVEPTRSSARQSQNRVTR